MLSVAEARERILSRVRVLEPESLPLSDSLGRVLAEDVRAEAAVPPFHNSAMDGYAVRAKDVRGATTERPARLQVIGEVRAGLAPAVAVRSATAVRIMTGAAIPDGADAVVRLEDTSEADGTVEIRAGADVGASVRRAGSDLRPGDVVGHSGRAITPGLIGVLAAAGKRTLRCVRRPRTLLLTTGDELRDAGEALSPGQITNTNRYTLRAAIEQAGGLVVDRGVARDDRDDLAAHLEVAREVDLVVTSGGVSMGAYDLVRTLLEDRDAMDFWQVALRPGKPLAFGSIHGVPLVGLPGNPVSALVGLELFVRPALLKMQGRTDLERPRLPATTDVPLSSPRHLEQYFRGIARRTAGGIRVRLTGEQDSHVLRSLADANCLVIVPPQVGEVRAGERVEILELGPIPVERA